MSTAATPRLRVGILGATGAVGQKFIELLEGHPWFEITALAASERSAGKSYRAAATWQSAAELPPHVAEMEVQGCTPELDCDFVFSGLDSSVAQEVETAFAEAGYPVVSNARNHRMDADVPLLVPEINADHAELVRRQGTFERGGYIVTNPNCSTVGLVCALAPLHARYGVEEVRATTMQALSGAGYPGVPSLDALGNVVPYIGGEEDKLATEPKKILGTLAEGGIEEASMTISAQCNRVPVQDGHLLSLSVRLREPATPEEAAETLRQYTSPLDAMDLPSAPDRLVHVFDEPHYPQPRLHASRGRGMQVSVGRVGACSVLGLQLVALVHNTVRGAAGVALLNAEYLVRQKLLQPRAVHA